jgi:RNA polymerase sigma-70 factor (sigma-E family)
MTSREDEFTAFAEAASSHLLGTAFLLCGDWHTAEDITQTTLAKLFASWHRIRNQDAVHGYARRTLLNTYLVDCRRKRRREVLTGEAGQFADRAAEWQDPALRLALTDALAALAPKARAVVVLRYWEDMSVDQVAALLGCSPGNVKSQSARSLEKLRRLLDDPWTSAEPSGERTGDGRGAREAGNGRDIAPRAI